jgi:predicted permease
VGLAVVMFVISITLSKTIYRRFPDDVSPVMQFTAIFSNCGYMGLPLMKALYGDEGVFYGSFYIVVFHTFLWTYGYMMFGGKGTAKQVTKKVLTNPSIIAVYVGLILFTLSIPVPEVIQEAVRIVGDMTMPLSMLIIGGVISTARLSTVFSDWRVYLASAVRLVVMPAIAIYGTMFLTFRASQSGGCHGPAMPIAANTTVFSEMFHRMLSSHPNAYRFQPCYPFYWHL